MLQFFRRSVPRKPSRSPAPGHGSWNVSSQVTKGDFSASFFLAINLVLSALALALHWLQYSLGVVKAVTTPAPCMQQKTKKNKTKEKC